MALDIRSLSYIVTIAYLRPPLLKFQQHPCSIVLLPLAVGKERRLFAKRPLLQTEIFGKEILQDLGLRFHHYSGAPG